MLLPNLTRLTLLLGLPSVALGRGGLGAPNPLDMDGQYNSIVSYTPQLDKGDGNSLGGKNPLSIAGGLAAGKAMTLDGQYNSIVSYTPQTAALDPDGKRVVLPRYQLRTAPVTAWDKPEHRIKEDDKDRHNFYTWNPVCMENYCFDPVIPGLHFLGENMIEKHKNMTWMCALTKETKDLHRLAGFCSRVVATYPFALPQAHVSEKEVDVIKEQEHKAMDTFVAHVSSMGFDFWDLTEPWNVEDECIKAVWKMSCYMHFPQCNVLDNAKYLPPCRSSCESYLKECKVECCDEGVHCSFKHARKMEDGSVVYEHGYPDHPGPSPFCTEMMSDAFRSLSLVPAGLLALLVATNH